MPIAGIERIGRIPFSADADTDTNADVDADANVDVNTDTNTHTGPEPGKPKRAPAGETTGDARLLSTFLKRG